MRLILAPPDNWWVSISDPAPSILFSNSWLNVVTILHQHNPHTSSFMTLNYKLQIQKHTLTFSWGTGIRGLMRGKVTRSCSGQRQSWKTPRWAWGEQVLGMWYFSFSALTLLAGREEGPVKKLDVGLLVVMIWLALCTTYSSSSPVVTTTSIIFCFNKHWLTQVHLENGR